MIRMTKAGPDITCKTHSMFPSERLLTLNDLDNQVPVVAWTCIEASVGIVAACLPNLRPLFRFGERGFWSQIRSTSQGSKKAMLDTATTNTSGNSIEKGPLDSYVSEEAGETHRYSAYMRPTSN